MILTANVVLATINGKYFAPNSGNVVTAGAAGTVGDSAGVLVPVPGTLNDLTILLDANVATEASTFTVYINNVATGITVAVAIGAAIGSDLIHSAAVAAGDYISIECPTNTSTGWTNGAVALQFIPA